MERPRSVCAFIVDAFGLFPLWATMRDAAVNIAYRSLCRHVFSSLVCLLRNTVAGSYANSVFTFLRKG